jgi:copper-containing nitrite reductase
VHWTIREAQNEIAPGVIYDDAWGFEGHVPGPLLRVRVGDLVEVHLRNALNSMRTHNIDFHFVMGPGGGASALSVAPGEEAVLEARATAPGFYMFHCATPDIPMHIANGMYGFVLVEPEEGLPAVGRELYVVQSEIYTNDDKPGHKNFDMVRADKADPQHVVFNGSVGALLKDHAPIATQNESVRIYVGNTGPNLISSFHVIGQIFDKVYREGDLLSPPARSLQTTLIPAGGSAVVEFTPPVPGTFLLVDHAIFRLHHGAVGSLNVHGQENAEIFQPMTPRNMAPMSEDAHLGNGSHEMEPPAKTAGDPGVHFAMAALGCRECEHGIVLCVAHEFGRLLLRRTPWCDASLSAFVRSAFPGTHGLGLSRSVRLGVQREVDVGVPWIETATNERAARSGSDESNRACVCVERLRLRRIVSVCHRGRLGDSGGAYIRTGRK